jgi:bifunctional non-homologous end joining protein LigD
MQFGPYSFEPSRLDKVLFPDSGFTKGDLIDYYSRIAEFMLPHLADRPLAMRRFPDGIRAEGFFQKTVPDYFPEWIQRTEVEREEGRISMLLVNNKATLAYLADQACIEHHVFPSRANHLRAPDKMIFDLDPPEEGFRLVIRAASALREILEAEQGLRAFVMTTGSRGLHVVVPLKPQLDFDPVRDYAHRICSELASRYPEDFTTEMRKDKRRGRLFLDYLRNAYGQHSIAPYGLRALPGAPVATPLHWEELDQLDGGAQTYRLKTIFRRLEQGGDPWKGWSRHARQLKLEDG